MRAAAALLLALAASAAAHAAAPAQHLYEVVVNGHDTGTMQIFTGDGDGLTASAKVWRKLGLVLPAEDGGDITAGALGVKTKVDEVTQTLSLAVPARLLPAQHIASDRQTTYAPPALSPRGAAAVLSYNVAATRGAESIEHTLTVPTKWGTFQTVGEFNVGGPAAGYQRVATSWWYDDLKHRLTYQAGDVLAAAPDGVTRLGGFELSRNYSLLDPTFQTWPLPSLDGLALDPGTLSILANRAVVSRQAVQAGPVSISTLPLASGANQVQAVVTDAYGRQQVVDTLSWYRSTTLLRPGLSTWDVAVGAPRVGNAGYSGAVATGEYSRGITNGLTLTGGGSVGQGGWSATLAADATPGLLGEIHASVGASSGGGRLLSLAYSYQRGGFAVSASHQQRTRWWTPQTYLLPPASRSDSLGVSYSRGGWSWTASATRATLGGSSFTYGQAGAAYRRGRFSADAGVYASGHDRGIFADLSLALGHVSGSAGMRGDERYATVGAGGNGWSTVAQTQEVGDAVTESARGVWVGSKGSLVAGVTRTARGTQWNLGASGSLLFDPLPEVSRAIAGNDGVVEVVVPGLVGVPVYVGGMYVGKTNHAGTLFFGPIASLSPVQIRIDVAKVPMDVVVAKDKMTAVVGRGGVARITFPVKAMEGRAFTATYGGKPVPEAATVAAGDEATAAGYAGMIYLQHPRAGETIRVSWKGHACTAHVPTPVPAFGAATAVRCE